MRIAFVLDEAVQAGGGFQQSLTTIISVLSLRNHEVVVLTNRPENLELLRGRGVSCHPYRFGFLRRMLTRAVIRHRHVRRAFGYLPKGLQRAWGPFDDVLDRFGVDLVVCFFLSWVPHYIYRLPFIATVYDLCHREHCEFPEVSERFEFEHREKSFRESLPRALSVLVSSPSLGRQVCRYYGVDYSRICVLPFLPALHARGAADAVEVARVRSKYSLPENYVFYPAQFWPHKNHVYLLDGLRAMGDLPEQAVIHVVFSGSNYGNQEYIRRVAERNGLADRVHFLGFVDSADMSALYSAARALVMPTYFGPTNIPPLEAMAIGCPVIYSDFPEFREELGDAALYCDLHDPASLAAQLRVVLTRPEVVESLTQAGRALLGRTGTQTYADKMQGLLDEFEYVRQRWTSAERLH